MSLITVYNAGTVSVVAGSTQVTGHSTGWLGAGVREGDYLWIAGFVVRIASCEGGQALTLAYPWPSTTMNNVAYEIQYTADVERTLGSAQNILSALRSGSFGALSALTPATDKMPYYTGHNTADVTTLTSFGRQVLATTDKNSLQTLLDLVAQSGDLDKTLNRVMKVGAFGLGTTAAPLIENIDSFEAAAGFYKVDARITEGVLPPSSNVADGLIILHPTASQTMQVYLGMTELGRNFIRKSNSDGTWAPWRSIMMDFEFGVGPGSGLDADTVDGFEADDFVKATDLTSGGMLAYIKEVDGANSGLDADLLDGLHATSFLRTDIDQDINGTKTFNVKPVFNDNGILFENGESRITYKDGGGNFTHRWGHEFASGNFISTRANSNAAYMRVNYAGTNTTWSIGLTTTPSVNKGDIMSFTDYLTLGKNALTWNDQRVATENFVNTRINEIVGAAPGALDTLNELAAALGDDPEFATTVNNKIATKLDTAAFTGSAILNRLTTVDGSGSGLDADLLDGKHASEFFKLNENEVTEGRISFNGANGEKIRIGQSGASSPYIGLYAGTTDRVGYIQSTTGRIRVVVDNGAHLDLYDTAGDVRINNNKVMHSGNDGVGSGFDADLLDGQHGTFYRDASNLNTGTVPAARLGNALLNTGGKITGTLMITYDSTITGQGNNETLFAYEGKDNYLRGRNTIVNTTLILANQASAANEAVRADRAINTGTGLSGGGNMTSNRTLSFDTSWGDNRYVQRSGDTITGTLSVPLGNEASPAIQWENTNNGIYWTLGHGPHFVAGGGTIGQLRGGDELEETYSIVTRQAGDARYLLQTGAGLVGGGNGSSNRTISLGTPSAITDTSTNSATGSTHTHSLSADAVLSLVSQGTAGSVGTYTLARSNTGEVLFGNTTAGSNLQPASLGSQQYNGSLVQINHRASTLSGTWQSMGHVPDGYSVKLGLFMRIS